MLVLIGNTTYELEAVRINGSVAYLSKKSNPYLSRGIGMTYRGLTLY